MDKKKHITLHKIKVSGHFLIILIITNTKWFEIFIIKNVYFSAFLGIIYNIHFKKWFESGLKH